MTKQPKATKFQRFQKRNLLKGLAATSTTQFKQLRYGTLGIKAAVAGYLTFAQIEAGRKVLNSVLKRSGRIWMSVYPSVPVTQKATGVRMGKGKGALSAWLIPIKIGTILFEVAPSALAGSQVFQALDLAQSKIGIRTNIFQEF